MTLRRTPTGQDWGSDLLPEYRTPSIKTPWLRRRRERQASRSRKMRKMHLGAAEDGLRSVLVHVT